jgi:hypothetical protein
MDLLKLQAGSTVKRLRDHCSVHVIDNSDHTFTRSDKRAALETILSNELFSPNRWGPRANRGTAPAVMQIDREAPVSDHDAGNPDARLYRDRN